MYNPNLHHRKSIRLKEYNYRNPNWYYITICTKDKKKYFGDIKNGEMILNEYGKIVEEEWLKTKIIRPNIELDEYVIMPNHFHGILIKETEDKIVEMSSLVNQKKPEQMTKNIQQVISPEFKSDTIGSIIGQFKSKVTKRIRIEGLSDFQWQRNYYEHIIRNEKDLFNIRQYIMMNPIKWEYDDYY